MRRMSKLDHGLALDLFAEAAMFLELAVAGAAEGQAEGQEREH